MPNIALSFFLWVSGCCGNGGTKISSTTYLVQLQHSKTPWSCQSACQNQCASLSGERQGKFEALNRHHLLQLFINSNGRKAALWLQIRLFIQNCTVITFSCEICKKYIFIYVWKRKILVRGDKTIQIIWRCSGLQPKIKLGSINKVWRKEGNKASRTVSTGIDRNSTVQLLWRITESVGQTLRVQAEFLNRSFKELSQIRAEGPW